MKTPKFNRSVQSLLKDREDIRQVIERVNKVGISADTEEVTNNFSVNDVCTFIPKIRQLCYNYERMIDAIIDEIEV